MSGGVLAAEPVHTAPEPTPQRVYQNSLVADERYSYSGRQVTTYWRTGRTVAVQVTHKAPGWLRLEYLDPDRLRGAVVLNDGRHQWEYDPRVRTIRHHALPAGAAAADPAVSYRLLKRNYTLLLLPVAKIIAERKAYVLLLRRKSTGTLAERISIDAGTGLALRTERFSEVGKPSVTVGYSEINYHPKFGRTTFTAPGMKGEAGVGSVAEAPDGERIVPLSTVAAQLESKAVAPGEVAGYRLVGAGLTRAASGRDVLHLRYSDGLTMVSIFETVKRQANRPTRVPGTMGLVRIGSVLTHQIRRASLVTVNWDNRALNVTLMGEVGEPALTRFVSIFSGP